MDTTDHRARVLELFEKHRATPGAPYDETHFLDYLLPAPKAKRAVHNSFRGLRRYNAFIDDVQYEFAICFSMKDHEASYPLSKFLARVIELQGSRRGSLASLKHQMNAGPGWQVLVIADLLLLFAAAFAKSYMWALLGVGVLALVVNAWFIRFAWRGKAYHRKLLAKLEGAELGT
jgi:hypothetical protein